MVKKWKKMKILTKNEKKWGAKKKNEKKKSKKMRSGQPAIFWHPQDILKIGWKVREISHVTIPGCISASMILEWL